jgi:hypothetical protein
MTEVVLWTLEKAGHKARAATKAIAGVGIELRFLWNNDLRQSQVLSQRRRTRRRGRREEARAARHRLA